jgi:hypothetical protein
MIFVRFLIYVAIALISWGCGGEESGYVSLIWVLNIFEKGIIIYGIISMKEALLLSFKKAETITVKDL